MNTFRKMGRALARRGDANVWHMDAYDPEKPWRCAVSGKRRHATKADAGRAARVERVPGLRSYRCVYCDDYHLTSRHVRR